MVKVLSLTKMDPSLGNMEMKRKRLQMKRTSLLLPLLFEFSSLSGVHSDLRFKVFHQFVDMFLAEK